MYVQQTLADEYLRYFLKTVSSITFVANFTKESFLRISIVTLATFYIVNVIQSFK